MVLHAELETFATDRGEWSLYRHYVVRQAVSGMFADADGRMALSDRIAPEYPRGHYTAEGLLLGPTFTATT